MYVTSVEKAINAATMLKRCPHSASDREVGEPEFRVRQKPIKGRTPRQSPHLSCREGTNYDAPDYNHGHMKMRTDASPVCTDSVY